MPFTLQAVPRRGNVYPFGRYQRASREERGQHLFASYCYECFEQGVADLPQRVQAECSVVLSGMLGGYAIRDEELGAVQERAVSTLREGIDELMRETEIACALQIVEYLKRHDGFIDSWPEARIHVPLDDGFVRQGHHDDAANAVAAAIGDYLRDEVYFTFTFPTAEEAIPLVAEEVSLEREQRELEACGARLNRSAVLVAYAFLPAGLLALHVFLRGPALLDGVLDAQNPLASLAARYRALPQAARLLAPVCAILFAVPALMALLFYGVYQYVNPMVGLAVGGAMGVVAALGILYGVREELRRRAAVAEHRSAINGLQRNESVVMARRERAEYRFVVQQLAQAMRM